MQVDLSERNKIPLAKIIDKIHLAKIIDRVDLWQRLQCARVNKFWKETVAECEDLTVECKIDPAAFQKWLQSYGKHLKTLTVRGVSTLVDLQLCARTTSCSAEYARHLFSKPFPGISSATNLTSVTTSNVSLGGEGRELLGALTALPTLQLLSLDSLKDVWYESEARRLQEPEEEFPDDTDFYKARQLHEELAEFTAPALNSDRWEDMPWHERNAPRYVTPVRQLLHNVALLHSVAQSTDRMQAHP
jgi:hypothetical protein